MKIYYVEHFFRDEKDQVSGTARHAFRLQRDAFSYVIKQARKIPNYDREAEKECRNGPAEYACAQLGAFILDLEVE